MSSLDRPICIYLDTQDYSRFADLSRTNDAQIRSVRDYLLERVAEEVIEIRFSVIHLWEFLKDPSQRDLAFRKAQVLDDLCGDRAFRYLTDIFDAERAAVASGSTNPPQVTSDDGEWFPDVMSESLPEVSLKEQLIRNFLNRFPQFSPEQIEEMLLKAMPTFKEQMPQVMPLGAAYDSNIIERFVAGEDIRDDMIKGAAKPQVLIGHYLDGLASARAFFSSLGPMEENLSDRLKRSREEIGQHVSRLLETGRTMEDIKRWAKARKEDFSRAAYLGLGSLPPEMRNSIAHGKYLEELPAISTHCNVFRAYMRDILMPSRSMPAIKDSDAADILHATYLPYVDLYRTDGRFGNLLENLPRPRRTQIVLKLLQLPAAIDQRLNH